MRAVDVTCRAVTGLIEEWHGGALGEDEQELLEQHVLVCPPCLVHLDVHRRGLRALAGVATPAPPDVVDRVLGLLGGRGSP